MYGTTMLPTSNTPYTDYIVKWTYHSMILKWRHMTSASVNPSNKGLKSSTFSAPCLYDYLIARGSQQSSIAFQFSLFLPIMENSHESNITTKLILSIKLILVNPPQGV